MKKGFGLIPSNENLIVAIKILKDKNDINKDLKDEYSKSDEQAL